MWLQFGQWALVILLTVPAGFFFHYFQANNRIGMAWSAYAFSILIFTAGLLFFLNAERSELRTQLTGELLPAAEPEPTNPCPDVPPNAFKIFMGNSASWTTNTAHTILRIGTEDVISIRRTNRGLALSCKVFSRDGRIVSRIRDNIFDVNPNNYFRLERRDRHSLVVYDQADRQVLSVRFLNPSTMYLLGDYQVPGHPVVVIGPEETRIGGVTLSRNCFGNNKVDIAVN